MKLARTAGVAGLFLAVASTAAFAGGNIVTRSVEDAHADLMRTYKSHGGTPAGTVNARNTDAARADLVRDWNAKTSSDAGAAVQARTQDASYVDLMRLWAGVLPARN